MFEIRSSVEYRVSNTSSVQDTLVACVRMFCTDPLSVCPQVAQYRETFAEYDKDGGGTLSPAEVLPMLRQLDQEPRTPAQREKLLEVRSGRSSPRGKAPCGGSSRHGGTHSTRRQKVCSSRLEASRLTPRRKGYFLQPRPGARNTRLRCAWLSIPPSNTTGFECVSGLGNRC